MLKAIELLLQLSSISLPYTYEADYFSLAKENPGFIKDKIGSIPIVHPLE